jgi:hypothetical protein
MRSNGTGASNKLGEYLVQPEWEQGLTEISALVFCAFGDILSAVRPYSFYKYRGLLWSCSARGEERAEAVRIIEFMRVAIVRQITGWHTAPVVTSWPIQHM